MVHTRFADLRWVSETGSTNRDLLELAADGDGDGVVEVADHQTAGRGRLDRSWLAPPESSLLLSVLFRVMADGPSGESRPIAADDAHLLVSAVVVSAAEACQMVAGVALRLKWPNDLVVPGEDGGIRKVGGVLAESTVLDDVVDAVVVGLGLNVNWPTALPEELATTAAALNHLAGHLVDREELLIALLQRLDHWCRQPGGDVMAQVRSRSATVGSRVRVDLGTEQVVGVARAIADSGSLLVDLDDGSRREVVVGDVVQLRPAD